MKVLDREVQLALQNDSMLSQSVGSKVFRYTVPARFESDYPFMRIVEVDNVPTDYEDDRSTKDHLLIQVDVWDRNPDRLLPEINRVMVDLGFTRANVRTQNDSQKNEVRKIMRYQIKI
ncbi:hypothetical protein MM326_15240 [Alkalihalobacillus sp. LMS6]|jgi:hypothetical protein|uniref:hypothetical protein n=1 Tax=Alkalihalobacillus sp. LMS6 TaxID=2924034 RepID=UPI0020D1B804|nr:hypothetical protein [Alkalihalobacillus sp. LMS6]UTR05451.1 hypothetical protein MM326_15240 [Alkalihalobacillus sp. LMS6]